LRIGGYVIATVTNAIKQRDVGVFLERCRYEELLFDVRGRACFWYIGLGSCG
jgi:hypothetical protein